MDIVILVAGMVVAVVGFALWLRARAAVDPLARVVENRPIVTMQYADRDGVVTDRSVAILRLEIDQDAGRVVRFQGWCDLRRAQREFRVDRILWLRDDVTGGAVSDIGRHLMRYRAPSLR